MNANKDMVIVSNNPAVRDQFDCCSFVDDDPCKVLSRARDLIHRGYRLLGHPLAGQLRLQNNPFRSVVLKKGSDLHTDSVMMIEASLERLRNITFIRKDDAMEDYGFLDLTLLNTLVSTC